MLLVRALMIALASLLVLAVACGGDDDDDGGDGGGDEDYYNQVANLLNQADSDVDDITSEYGGPYTDDQDEIEDTRTAINETGRVVETLLLDLSDIEPPSEAESAHSSYLETLQNALANFASLSADLEDVETKADLDAVEEQYGPIVQQHNQDVEDACLVLQGLADDAGSGADLSCTD